MIVYHGSCSNVLEYFEGFGFRCPERKGVADFLQEVVSRNDQAKYWCQTEQAYDYVPIQALSMRFKESYLGKELNEEISKPLMRLQSHENAISFHVYSLSKWILLELAWLEWGFWVSPLSYGEIGLEVTEFLSPRWNKMSTNTTIGLQTLQSRGLDFDGCYFWISLGALFGFALLFNIGFVLALSYLKAPGTRAIISKEKLSQAHGSEGSKHHTHKDKTTNSNAAVSQPSEGKMVFPFEPLMITF